MASLNFNHAQSNSKKWAKKIKLPQMKFFFKKQLLKFSCTHSPLSFCKILKQFLEPIQSYEDKPFLGQKWPICPEQIFFGTNYYYFYPPIGPFHCAKFKKISYSGSWVMRLCHFGAQNGLFASKTFLEKIINIIFIYLLVTLKKKFLQRIQIISGLKMAHLPKWESFQKTCSWALFLSFMPIYMPKIKVRY